MKPMLVSLIAAVALLAGCASTDTVTRNAENRGLSIATQGELGAKPAAVVMASNYDVRSVNVSVPRTLSVSEANLYFPIADVIWRGEPLGDRHLQVESMFDEALFRATGPMKRGRPVAVEVEVTRFHGVTEKTRYTVGGVYSLRFNLTVRDASSGAIVDGPRVIVADTKASGGAKAIKEEQMGLTQRVVVVNRLAEVLRRELSVPVTAPLLLGDAGTAATDAPVIALR